MWYGAYDGLHTIGLATSPDGIVWTKQNDGRSLPGLAGEQQLGPTVYFDGSRYLMFYNTGAKVPTGGGIWTLFAATSDDGITWQPVMDGRQLLGPAPVGNFASADGIIGNNHAVHPTKLIFAGGQVLIWYGGESNHARPGTRYGVSAIGLMGAKPGQVR